MFEDSDNILIQAIVIAAFWAGGAVVFILSVVGIMAGLRALFG